MAEKQWKGTTFGNGLMHRGLIALLRAVDVRFIYVLAYVFAVTPTLFKPGFRHAYRFFRERFGQSKLRSLWMAYTEAPRQTGGWHPPGGNKGWTTQEGWMCVE